MAQRSDGVAALAPATRSETFLRSSIGRKAVMAVSGVVLFGFVFVHMIGNLQVFLADHEAINHYGVFLRQFLHGGAIWVARAVLLAAVAVHIAAGWSLVRTNERARPVPYRVKAPDASTYASRTMRWGGPIILLFVIYHLLHMTIGSVHPDFVEGDVYRNIVTGFSAWQVTLFYVLAMLALGFHLQHGVWSMLQTLGVSHPRWDRRRRTAATAFAVVVTAGFVAVPLAVLAGFVR